MKSQKLPQRKIFSKHPIHALRVAFDTAAKRLAEKNLIRIARRSIRKKTPIPEDVRRGITQSPNAAKILSALYLAAVRFNSKEQDWLWKHQAQPDYDPKDLGAALIAYTQNACYAFSDHWVKHVLSHPKAYDIPQSDKVEALKNLTYHSNDTDLKSIRHIRHAPGKILSRHNIYDVLKHQASKHGYLTPQTTRLLFNFPGGQYLTFEQLKDIGLKLTSTINTIRRERRDFYTDSHAELEDMQDWASSYEIRDHKEYIRDKLEYYEERLEALLGALDVVIDELQNINRPRGPGRRKKHREKQPEPSFNPLFDPT